MKSILDPSFKYINACSTDIRKTFQRVRQQQKDNGVVVSRVKAPLLEIAEVIYLPRKIRR